MEEVQGARRGLTIYFAILIPASALLEWLILRKGESLWLIACLMWVPAVASIIARVAQREGIRDVSFGLGGGRGRKALLLAWIFPVAVGTFAYGGAWVSRLAILSPPAVDTMGIHPTHPLARLTLLLALGLSRGTLFGVLFAAGEEIGWRGYMLTRLFAGKVPRPVLLSGLVCGAWHLPLLWDGMYPSDSGQVAPTVSFLVSIVAVSYLLARLRLESGSVWPAVLLHASWNATIQGVFDASTKGGALWVGESGILVAMANLFLVRLLVRGRWPAKRRSSDASFAELRALDV